jgi:hypothetical protein
MRNRRHARLWRGVKAELEESERQARQQATNKGVPHSASIALPLIFSPRSASRLTVLLFLRVALAVASMSRGNAMLNHSGNGGREDHQLGKKAPTAGLPARVVLRRSYGGSVSRVRVTRRGRHRGKGSNN